MLKKYSDKIGLIVQARMNSTRLPGKVLKPFNGFPLLIYKINLIKKLDVNYQIVVATTNNDIDNDIVSMCSKNKIDCFRGPEKNVFKRFKQLLEIYNFDHIIRLTADNPLLNVSILEECIKNHFIYNNDLTTTRKILPSKKIISYSPKGLSIDIIRAELIRNMNVQLLNEFEKEHIIPYYFNNNNKIGYVKSQNIKGNYTIDTEEEFIKVENFVKSFDNFGELKSFLIKK